MKRILLILIIHCSLFIVHCTAQDWLWAKTAGGTKNASAYSIATDDSGNVFIAGNFKSKSITFGDTTFLNPDSIEQMFLVKYSAQGNVIWVRSVVSKTWSESTTVTTNKFGNIYVGGWFGTDTLNFGHHKLIQPGATMFIVKYDENGNDLWAKDAIGVSAGNVINGNEPTSISADTIGNTYVTGWFIGMDSLVFGTFTLYPRVVQTYTMFLVKYNNLGKVDWAICNGGSSDVDIGDIYVTADVFGNIYLAGDFEGQNITFGDSILTNSHFSATPIFLVKFTNSGKVLWTRMIAKKSIDDYVSSVTTDVYGNIYFAGEFGDWIDLGTYIFKSADQDMFLIKYDDTGKLLWATRSIGDQTDYSTSVAIDKSGNIFMTGYIDSDTISFDSIKLTRTSSNYLFLVKYNATGQVDWVIAGSSGCFGESVATDKSGNIYEGGFFGGHSFFGSTELTCVGGSNIFIAKLAYNTGINELTIDNGQWTIYPNPANDYINIAITCYSRETNFIFYNLIGEKIKSGKINSPLSRIHVAGLNDGLYILNMRNTDFNISRKILINHK